jgi:class 3 adenylate cyclase
MGFGLHLGYSIEGAIGSMYKIDASYLSPNVNMAGKLEEKTKEYGVPILISGSFYKFMSSEAKTFLRQVDLINIGTEEHVDLLELYTVDFDVNMLAIEESRVTSKKTYAPKQVSQVVVINLE